MWAEARESVIEHFPQPPGLPKNTEKDLHKFEEIYQYDAYNSSVQRIISLYFRAKFAPFYRNTATYSLYLLVYLA